MASTRRTVRQLADEANIDIDAALVSLWDAGFDEIDGPNNSFGRQKLNRARRAIGLATRRELRSINYWIKLFKLDEAEFRKLLDDLRVPLKTKTRKLMPKAITRLKGEARKRGFDHITGKPIIKGDKTTKPSVFSWKTPGHKRELRWLSANEVRAIHFELVDNFLFTSDPIEPPGVKSEQLLGSAIFRPYTSLGGIFKYPTVETSAAALLHAIIQDHPFHNGNKRTALVSMLVFLDENGVFPEFNQDSIFKLVLQVAQHAIVSSYPENLSDREVLAISEWLCSNCRILEKGERQVPFRKLRQILIGYDCKLENTTGGKINVTRVIRKQSKFGITMKNILKAGNIFRKTESLHSQIPYSGDGREVGISTIKNIRRDLQLDEPRGIDSHAFYSKDPMMVSDFIAHYRKTLQRLAKF